MRELAFDLFGFVEFSHALQEEGVHLFRLFGTLHDQVT